MLDWLLEKATKYEPLIKTGVAALSTYASYKDQAKKNEMQQAAYDDYMRAVAAAGQEAQAAVGLNLTPMTVSGVPQTKADVTDFTAVAARGGLMSIPNKQRKRYALGTPDEFEVETMDEEVLSPFDLQQETGLDLSGEQAKYDQGSPRKNAAMVWGNMGTGDKEPYQFDFEIFFQSGDWMDMIKSEITGGGDTQVASAPDPTEMLDTMAMNEFGKLWKDLTNEEKDALNEMGHQEGRAPVEETGIMQAAKGGRIGYRFGEEVIADQETILKTPNEEIVVNDMDEIKRHMAGPDWFIKRIENLNYLFGDKLTEKEIEVIAADDEKYYDKLGHDPFSGAKGGRVKRAPGGIMDLGGMEKDYRTTGGFVPLGEYERKDDVPARLSKNEFVMTADAVRAAGGGSINRGAQRMYDTMKHLEANPQSRRMTA